MPALNKVMLLGNLGSDPELSYTSNGTSVCNFNLATNESWTGKDGKKQERTEWHRIVVWDKQAENCVQYLKKGSLCFLEGKNQTRSWEDKDGNKRYITEVVARYVLFLSGSGGGGGQRREDPPPHDDGDKDDIPF